MIALVERSAYTPRRIYNTLVRIFQDSLIHKDFFGWYENLLR
jgi:hypothetical protein